MSLCEETANAIESTTTTTIPSGGSSLSIDIEPDGRVSVYGDTVSVLVALHEMGLCPDGGEGE